MEPIEVVLGERTFTIEEPSINRGERWREMLGGPLDDIVEMVAGLDTEIDSIADIQAIVPRMKSLLMGSVTQIADLVCSWDKEFESERDYILENATGSQVVEALTNMVKMAFPFAGALEGLTRMSRGLPSAPTLTSSPVLNGAAGATSSAKQP